MSEAEYIELPVHPSGKRPFFKTWKGAVLILFILAVIVAGCFSWWLSEGKVSSSYARVDTVVYTVQPEIPARVDKILVREGEEVREGQPLAIIDSAPEMPQNITPAPEAAPTSPTEQSEKRIATQLAQARAEEANLQRLHHQRVTEHVRAQLALRSVNPAFVGAYEEAARMEVEARNSMNQAREEFEKASKKRAALDLELAHIHYEIARRGPRSRKPSSPPPVPAPAPPAVAQAPVLESLYAPISGRIIGVGAIDGQNVYKGQPIFMIRPIDQDTSGIWIQAWFPMAAQRLLKVGQKAAIKSGDIHVTGRVAVISTEPQYLPNDSKKGEYTQFLPVQISIDDPAELARLTPGANVECQIQTRYMINENAF